MTPAHTTPPLDWRAEPLEGIYKNAWRVRDIERDQIICSGVEEWQARLIAAALAKERLCEELADALETLAHEFKQTVRIATERMQEHGMDVDPPERTYEPILDGVTRTNALLKQAGRAPQ